METNGLIRSHQSSLSIVYRLVDLMFIGGCLLLSTFAYNVDLNLLYGTTALTSMVIFLMLAEVVGLYRSWRADSVKQMITLTCSCWVITVSSLLMVAFFTKLNTDFSRVVIGGWALSTFLLLALWRLAFRKLLFKIRASGRNTRRAAVVGLTDGGVRMMNAINRHKETGIVFDGFFDDRKADRFDDELRKDLKGNINQLIKLTNNNQYDLIFVALPFKAQKRIADIMIQCGDTTASILLIPDFFTYNLVNARMGSVGDVQTLSVFETPFNGINEATKRLFDIIFSTMSLVFLALPMLMIAISIKLTSKGPVLFKQDRYGLDGRKIKVWKFRSMSTMDNGDKVTQATKNDSRVTPLGAVLRRTSLDELPQFINVLQGQMSVVGPRPHAVAHNELYRKEISYYMMRHKVKPGITGWAQINGWRGETDTLQKMQKRIEHDLDYIRHWTAWLDLKIIFQTILKGFVDKNAY